MTKNGVYPTVILRVSYGYPSVKGANDPIKRLKHVSAGLKDEELPFWQKQGDGTGIDDYRMSA